MTPKKWILLFLILLECNSPNTPLTPLSSWIENRVSQLHDWAACSYRHYLIDTPPRLFHGAVIDQLYDGYQLTCITLKFNLFIHVYMYIHMLVHMRRESCFYMWHIHVLSSQSVSCLVNWNRNPTSKNLEYLIYNLIHKLMWKIKCLMYGSELCCGLAVAYPICKDGQKTRWWLAPIKMY